MSNSPWTVIEWFKESDSFICIIIEWDPIYVDYKPGVSFRVFGFFPENNSLEYG